MADPSYSWQIDTAHYHRYQRPSQEASSSLSLPRFRALFFILLALYIGYTLFLTAKVQPNPLPKH